MPKTSPPPRPQLERMSIAIAFMLVCMSPIGAVALEGDLDFSGRIRPLLASRCFNCHGPDPETREAGLRLDTQTGALALLESGDHAIIAGNSKESEILHRVQSRETGYRMPPEDAGEPLSEEEISLLRAWIDAGAVYDTHWSFVQRAMRSPRFTTKEFSKSGTSCQIPSSEICKPGICSTEMIVKAP